MRATADRRESRARGRGSVRGGVTLPLVVAAATVSVAPVAAWLEAVMPVTSVVELIAAVRLAYVVDEPKNRTWHRSPLTSSIGMRVTTTGRL